MIFRSIEHPILRLVPGLEDEKLAVIDVKRVAGPMAFNARLYSRVSCQLHHVNEINSLQRKEYEGRDLDRTGYCWRTNHA